jgi:archaellum component FlaC
MRNNRFEKRFFIMDREKIENKIKELNSFRAMCQKDFKEIERRYKDRIISEKNYEKYKHKYESKIEKIREKIRKLEEKYEDMKRDIEE